jgi:hypothetical protein
VLDTPMSSKCYPFFSGLIVLYIKILKAELEGPN